MKADTITIGRMELAWASLELAAQQMHKLIRNARDGTLSPAEAAPDFAEIRETVTQALK